VSQPALQFTLRDATYPVEKLIAKVSLASQVWESISQSGYDQVKTFQLNDYNVSRSDVTGFLKHFQLCQDCVADGTYLLATQDERQHDVLRMVRTNFSILTDDGDDDNWNDWTGSEEAVVEEYPTVLDDQMLLHVTQQWVDKGTPY
jgi:hypothetical protein